MEKSLELKNRGNVEAELREQWTPLLQSQLAERLFVCLWSLANPPPPPFIIQLKLLNTRTSNQNVSESPTAKMVSLASGADLVCWGPLKLHIILAFIIFSRRATALTQGLFVSLCLLCPSTPKRPSRLLSPLNTFGTGLRLWLKNTNVSMVPFSSYACPFGSALAGRSFWLRETCAALMKICLSISSKGHSALTSQSHSSFCSSDVEHEITLAWRNSL